MVRRDDRLGQHDLMMAALTIVGATAPGYSETQY